ncbi:MAG: F0F1 ATP synthase subunit delta [Hyphomonadaceae bacterium]
MTEAVDGAGAEAAERYAQAAFELALDAQALETVEADFAALDAAFAGSADLRAAAASPLIDPEEKTRALVAVAEKIGLSPLGRNIVGAVSKNRRAAALPQIARAFRARLARYRGARQAEIISAKPLAEAERQSILAALEKSLGAKVEAEARVDESLIGGFIVRVGSRQFDASIKSKLASLKLALKSA